jgi:hypothetical protein
MTELCASFGIARETGYVWLRRYRQSGIAGLVELNRAPHRHANQTLEPIERAVLELRQQHMRWGPRKLKRILERDQPGRPWPATSTTSRQPRASSPESGPSASRSSTSPNPITSSSTAGTSAAPKEADIEKLTSKDDFAHLFLNRLL